MRVRARAHTPTYRVPLLTSMVGMSACTQVLRFRNPSVDPIRASTRANCPYTHQVVQQGESRSLLRKIRNNAFRCEQVNRACSPRLHLNAMHHDKCFVVMHSDPLIDFFLG